MKYLTILLIAFFSFSCSKEVSSNSTNLTPSQNPVIEVPSENNSGVLTLTFANHATVNDPENELTVYSLSEPLLLTLPSQLSSITYVSSGYKPNLTVLVNDEQVCVYIWNLGSYKKSQSCVTDLDLTPNDVVTVLNIPKSQTISLTVQYQR